MNKNAWIDLITGLILLLILFWIVINSDNN